MKPITVLGNDPRPITGIYGTFAKSVHYQHSIEKIEAYIEDSDTVWFAIFRKGRIWQRINSRFVDSVTY